MDATTIRNGVRIALTELRCYRREAGGLRDRPLLLTAVLTGSLALGAIAARGAGALESAEPDSAVAVLGFVAGAAFVSLAWWSALVARERFELLNPDFLLTTVPTASAGVGLLCFTFARVAIPLALPAAAVAVGTAAGLRSPEVALTTLVAIAGLATLAASVGTAGRLAARLVGSRLARAGVYRDLLLVFGWIPLFAAWLVLQRSSLSLEPLLGWLDAQPVAWFADLALLGTGEAGIADGRRALGALGLLFAAPVAAGATTVFAHRIWARESSPSSRSSDSRSLVGDGWIERLLGGRVPRPVLTVVRERLLLERRVRRGLLSTGYVLFYVGVFLVPAFVLGGGAAFLLVAVALGMAAGIALAANLLEVEYRTLPMLATTVRGRQFVGGLVLASLLVGIPVVVAVVVPLGLVGPVGVPETVAVALVGVAVCACTASVTAAVDAAVDRDAVVPMPFFFTDVPVHAETGWRAFRRLATTFAIVTLVALPAMLGNSAPIYEPAAAAGLPTAAVRLGSLLATAALALGVAAVAFRIAVERYDDLRFD